MNKTEKEVTGSWKKFHDYRFLAAEDLTQDVKVTIDKVVTDEAFNGREKETVMVLKFIGKEKGIICNKTNAKRITRIVGSQKVEDWKGVEITLTTESVSAFGTTTDAIRVKEDFSNVRM